MVNISLRKITLNDTDNILKWKNNPNVKKNFCIQDNLTKENHLNWFNNRILTKEVEQFIIVDNDASLDIGSIYLRDIDIRNKKAELGIFIGNDSARGRGIGSQSVKMIVEYGFKELRLT